MAAQRRAPGTCVSWNKTHKTWVGYVVIGRKLNGKGVEVDDKLYRRSSTPGRAGEREVEDALERAVTQHADDLVAAEMAADPRNYTLWEAIVDWHAWVPSQKTSRGTADKLLSQVRKWLKPRIGDVSIFDIDVERLSNYFEEIAEDLGASSLSDQKSTVKRALDYAMREKSRTHFTGPNAATLLGDWLPEAGHKPRPWDFFTMQQVEAVLQATEGTWMHAMFAVGFLMGLRPGEIRALKWGRDGVDLRKGVIYVLKAARQGGDGETKTKTSRRSITMPQRVVDALRKHQERFGQHEYVFPREDGRQFDKDGLSWRVGKAFKAAGIDGIEDPYVWRHTFASICYDRGVTIKQISEMMGHANERVTITIYAHRFNPDAVDTKSAMDAIWGSAA